MYIYNQQIYIVNFVPDFLSPEKFCKEFADTHTHASTQNYEKKLFANRKIVFFSLVSIIELERLSRIQGLLHL